MSAIELLPADARSWTGHWAANREQWGPGRWQDEPDKISWTDPDTGRPCLIVRNRRGALCGYAAVDPGHLLHGVDHTDVDVDVHGGELTYSGLCQDSEDESHGICHVPQPGEPEHVWWFGFDCGHAWDLAPQDAVIGIRLPGAVYRDVGYVAAEVTRLAAQLAAASSR